MPIMIFSPVANLMHHFLLKNSHSIIFHCKSVWRVVHQICDWAKYHTGKSMSEALIVESVNPQYDGRLFIDFQEKYKFTTCCIQKLFFFHHYVLKFVFSKKATKIDEIFAVNLTLTTLCQDFFQILWPS